MSHILHTIKFNATEKEHYYSFSRTECQQTKTSSLNMIIRKSLEEEPCEVTGTRLLAAVQLRN